MIQTTIKLIKDCEYSRYWLNRAVDFARVQSGDVRMSSESSNLFIIRFPSYRRYVNWLDVIDTPNFGYIELAFA